MLPENFGFLGRESEKLPHAQAVEGGAFLEPLRKLAQKHGLGILAGSIPEQGPDAQHVYNTSVMLGTSGETLASYRKIHLFDIDIPGEVSFQESSAVAAGETAVVVDFEGWGIGLSVCYDLRFAHLYQVLVDEDHWEVLLRARAIENQCFVIAPNQFGHHSKGRASWGKSLIVDPWGTITALMPEKEGFVMAQLGPEELKRVRRGLPCLEHRRPVQKYGN
jgi:predicted amidohydrolase